MQEIVDFCIIFPFFFSDVLFFFSVFLTKNVNATFRVVHEVESYTCNGTVHGNQCHFNPRVNDFPLLYNTKINRTKAHEEEHYVSYKFFFQFFDFYLHHLYADFERVLFDIRDGSFMTL